MMDHVSGPENAGPENDGQILLQNTAPENDGPRKSQGLKMQDQNKAEHIAWLENARPENAELENAAVLRKRIKWPRKRISKYYKNTRKHRQTEMATIIASNRDYSRQFASVDEPTATIVAKTATATHCRRFGRVASVDVV